MKFDGGSVFRSRNACCIFAAAFCAAALSGPQSHAQRSGAPVPNKAQLGTLGEQVNTNTIAIVSGNLNASYLTIAYDLSAVLDNGDEFRVLPVVGKGGAQNVRDVRFLKGVDLGLTQSLLLNYYRRNNELGRIDDKIVYIAKLFNEEMHLLVRAESGIASIEQLAGKKVNFSDAGSNTQFATRAIFERLGLKVEEVTMGQGDAIEKLKSGEIAATVLFSGKPAASMAKLKISDGFRMLPVAYSKPLQEDFLPTELTAEDYPGLIEPGRKLETIAGSAILIAYNWPKNTDRYRRIQKFVDVFFPRLAELQKPPRHPKWRETNLTAVVPGWKRFEGAEEWLRTHAAVSQAERGRFDSVLEARQAEPASLVSDERDRLFQEFMKWSKARERQ